MLVGTLTHEGTVTAPVTVGPAATLTGDGTINGNLTIDGTYSGTMDFSPGTADANVVTLNSTGTITAGATLDLGDGSDTFDHMGALLGTVDYGAGEDRHIYHLDDPAMEIGSIVSGGVDSDSDILELTVNRDGSATGDAEQLINWDNFINWDALEVTGGTYTTVGDGVFDDGVDITDGSLNVDGTLTVPTGENINVGSDGTLGGNGVITGDVQVSGTLSPGGVGEIGDLTINGDVDFEPGFELDRRTRRAAERCRHVDDQRRRRSGRPH